MKLSAPCRYIKAFVYPSTDIFPCESSAYLMITWRTMAKNVSIRDESVLLPLAARNSPKYAFRRCLGT